MLELATQWETRRIPLIQAYRELKDLSANKMVKKNYFFFFSCCCCCCF